MGERLLYELATADGASISPYVWRSKFALGRKRLPYRSCPIGFTDIAAVGPGSFRSVPILRDGDEWIGDSWDIADHLDRTYPDVPPIFRSRGERGNARFFEKWMSVEVISRLTRVCVLDIHDRLKAEDRAYFRESREARLGQSLESLHEDRLTQVPLLCAVLQPLRSSLEQQPFIGGECPTYSDYIGASSFIWAGSVATLQILKPDDPILLWLNRCLSLHGNIAAGLELPGLPPFRT